MQLKIWFSIFISHDNHTTIDPKNIQPATCKKYAVPKGRFFAEKLIKKGKNYKEHRNTPCSDNADR